MNKRILTGGAIALCLMFAVIGIVRCSSGSSSSSGGSTTTTTRTVDANTTVSTAVTTTYGGICNKLTRDTSSCQSARTALGFSGNWLLFSCNVVLGLVDSSGNSVSSYSSATYVTATITDLPDYTSNYYATSGTYSFTANSATVSGNFSDMYSAYTTSFPDPSYIAQQSMVAKIPITPDVNQTDTQGFGMVGVALNGVSILDSAAANTDSIFAESGSFDQCQGHPNSQNGGTYHYHTEPYSLSYDDNNVIGIMLDGYWIYGRKDHDGTYPTVGTSGNVFTYGGHTGSSPYDGTGNAFHYHVTLWTACYDEYHSGGTTNSYSDDGASTCTHMSGGVTTGTLVNGYFLTGHGNGGVFRTIPTGATNQTTTAHRYFYGTPGTCTGC